MPLLVLFCGDCLKKSGSRFLGAKHIMQVHGKKGATENNNSPMVFAGAIYYAK